MADQETVLFYDVVEMCALLQCLGYTVKSFDVDETIIKKQEGIAAPKKIIINCQTSGLHVELESPASVCSCPTQRTEEIWEVSGMSGGIRTQTVKEECILRFLPKDYRDRLSKELFDVMRCIQDINHVDTTKPADIMSSITDLAVKTVNKSSSLAVLSNKSTSLVDQANESVADLNNKSGSHVEIGKQNKSASVPEVDTPEITRNHLAVKTEIPTRYRSLDTLTKDGQPLFNPPLGENSDLRMNLMRQSTYTVSSTPDSKRRNKTSSPINTQPSYLLDSLIEAQKGAQNTSNILAALIKQHMDDHKHDTSSLSSVLDVSKISVLKGLDSKTQFASSPNLSGLSLLDDYASTKNRLNRESASTSNLAKPTPDSFKSKLKRLSPSMFNKPKKYVLAAKDKDEKSKLQSISKTKIATPVLKKKIDSPANLSLKNSKKFSHIKSTIPRPTTTVIPKKD